MLQRKRYSWPLSAGVIDRVDGIIDRVDGIIYRVDGVIDLHCWNRLLTMKGRTVFYGLNLDENTDSILRYDSTWTQWGEWFLKLTNMTQLNLPVIRIIFTILLFGLLLTDLQATLREYSRTRRHAIILLRRRSWFT